MDFQFDEPAVCVPLISSTGHGRATLNRVLFQEGRFALSNLLAALTVRDPSSIDPYFLYVYLNEFKDDLIVPLMVGSANMALTPTALGGLVVPIPPMDEQIHAASNHRELSRVERLRNLAQERTRVLLSSIFVEMFGDPILNPRGWPARELRQLGSIITGNTPPRAAADLYGGDLEWLKPGNLSGAGLRATPAIERLSPRGRRFARTVPPGSVLTTCIAGGLGSLGNSAIVDREVAFNQQINAISPRVGVDSWFLLGLISTLRSELRRIATGGMTRIVSKGKFEQLPAFEPPSEVQAEFGQRAQAVGDLVQKVIEADAATRELSKALMHELLPAP